MDAINKLKETIKDIRKDYPIIKVKKETLEKPFLVLEHMQHEKAIEKLKEKIYELKVYSQIENRSIKTEVQNIRDIVEREKEYIETSINHKIDEVKKECNQNSVDISHEVCKEFINNQSVEINRLLNQRMKLKFWRFAVIDTRKFNLRGIS